MQIFTKKGEKRVRLSQGEKSAIETTLETCDVLERMFDDDDAATVVGHLGALTARYGDKAEQAEEKETEGDGNNS